MLNLSLPVAFLIIFGQIAIAETRISGGLMRNTCTELCELSYWQSATLETLHATLDAGVNLNGHDERGDTPLHWVAASKDPNLAQTLIDAGAVVNVVNESGFTPLSIALDSGNLALMKVLLENDANLYLRGDRFGTLLHSAVSWEHTDIVMYLLEMGLSPYEVNVDGNTPIQKTAHRHDPEIMALLLADRSPGLAMLENAIQLSSLDQANRNGETALHWAVFFGNSGFEVAKMLLDIGANPNIQDEDGQTPLHKAVRVGGPEIISLLIRFGADASILDRDGYSVFDLAQQNERLIGTSVYQQLKDAVP